MDEKELTKKIYSYALYSASVIILILSILTGYFFIVILSAILLLFSVIYLHTGHIINNILIKRSRIIEISNNYTLSSNTVCVFKHEGRYYKSISIAIIRPETAPSISSEEFTSLIESIHEPFEYSISMVEIDKKKVVEPLETKRRMKEIFLTKIKADRYDQINNIKREIELLGSEIESIKASGKAYDISILLKASYFSESEAEATSQSYKNLERIADAFSAALKINYEIIKGEELLNYFS